MNSRKTSSGFTLMEVAVAGALVAILSACVFRGILTVKQNSQATAQRIAAQGLCLHRYEEMKAVAFELIEESNFPATNVLLASLSKDPAKGLVMAEITNRIAVAEGVPERKNVDITCKWTFRGRERTEVLHGIIVNGYSTYAEYGSISGTIALNPNFELPIMFYARGTDGSVYTQANLSSMPGSFTASTIVIKPGGGGRQDITIGGNTKSVSNDKVFSFTAAGLGNPISVSVTKHTVTVTTDGESSSLVNYSLALSCDQASFSYR